MMIELLAQQPNPAGSSGFVQFMLKGGIFMVPLTIASIVGLTAVLYKFFSLARGRVIPPELEREVAALEDVPGNGRAEAVLREFQAGRSTLARLGAVAVKHRARSREDLNQVMEAAAREESVRLHAGIGVLDVVITVAPLLGLLGTASGLVVIFQGLGHTTNHFTIARGISEALNTTIFGLAIAVPCVVAHGYFVRRIERLTARLEILLSDLIHVCQKDNPGA